MSLALLLAVQQGLPRHSKLDDAMFWVGALFAFTPIVVGLSVLGYVWWSRRKKRESNDDGAIPK